MWSAIKEQENLGILRGPAILDWQGNMYTAGEMNDIMHEILEDLLQKKLHYSKQI